MPLSLVGPDVCVCRSASPELAGQDAGDNRHVYSLRWIMNDEGSSPPPRGEWGIILHPQGFIFPFVFITDSVEEKYFEKKTGTTPSPRPPSLAQMFSYALPVKTVQTGGTHKWERRAQRRCNLKGKLEPSTHQLQISNSPRIHTTVNHCW